MTRKESDGHKTETPDVSHIRNVETAHEMSDVSVRGVATFVIALTVAAIMVHIGMWLLFRYFNAQEAKAPQPGPMALQQSERLPPEPRLQAAPGFELRLQDGQTERLELKAPQSEYRALRNQWEKSLSGELKDQSGNPTSIPIEQAMKQIVSQGLPARAQNGPTKLQDWAVSLPTAWSSAQATEKRLQ